MHQLRKLLGKSKKLLKTLHRNQIFNYNPTKDFYSNERPAVILGIESSCDDTGFAIVDSTGRILGEALNSQLVYHLKLGGINPANARTLHNDNIQKVYEDCFKSANMHINNVDAIAVTVKPGLPLSLIVGRDFAQHLSRIADKPVIPIHHMQAHALTIRMTEKIDFPFLVLLMSGGHCLLALVKAVDQFKLLGQTIDDPPGEAFDKVARRLNLIKIPEYSEICGGQALELAASRADNPNQFEFPTMLAHYRDCNFSFAGLKSKARRYIEEQEKKYNLSESDIIPDVNNLCAGFLFSATKHLCMRTERAMEFIQKNELIPEDKKVLVVSGGVASNNIIANGLKKVCEQQGYRLVRPPPKLCTDNGVMIAWNGIEKYMINKGVIRDKSEIDKIDIAHRVPIGEDWRCQVINEGIRRKWTKLRFEELVTQ